MFKQTVSIVACETLYNILFEIKHLFKFNITNFKTPRDFLGIVELNNEELINSLILTNQEIEIITSHNKINKNNILFLEELPLKIEKLLDKINTQLIKIKYNYQSKLSIKSYFINLNSRIISKQNNELKLTEREIDIILFLNENKLPQSVDILQKEVWGHSFDLETHTVETHIYRLRKKIKNKFNDENFITSHENGYLIWMSKKNPIAKELRTKKYKLRVVKAKKGKGSFKRKNK